MEPALRQASAPGRPPRHQVRGLFLHPPTSPPLVVPSYKGCRPGATKGRVRGPVSGALKGPGSRARWRGAGGSHRLGVSQGRVYWQMYNFYEAEAAASGKPLLRINMDETSVPLVPPALQGVVMPPPPGQEGGRPPRFRAGRNLQRANLTYVAFVSDDAALNQELPHFVIGCKATLRLRDFPDLFDAAPDHVFLIRGETSAWVTREVLGQIFRVLGKVLERVRPDAAFVLVFDCAPQHLHEGLFRSLRAHGIFPLLVPKLVTWLLQPLDVYVFRLFKETLRRRFHDAVARHHALVDIAWFLPLLYEVIEDTIRGRRWSQIFRRLGLGDGQAGVSGYVKSHMEVDRVDPVPALPPSEEDIAAILPRNRHVPQFAFGPLPKPKALGAPPKLLAICDRPVPAAVPELVLSAPAPMHHPYLTRHHLRGLALEASASQEPASSSPAPPPSAAAPGGPAGAAWPAAPPPRPRPPPPKLAPMPLALPAKPPPPAPASPPPPPGPGPPTPRRSKCKPSWVEPPAPTARRLPSPYSKPKGASSVSKRSG